MPAFIPTRIETILAKVSATLANTTRWEESNLLGLLDDGHKLIARRTEVLKKTTVVPLLKGQADYTLDPSVYKIHRILYQGNKINIRTREHLDKTVGPSWETEEGDDVQLVVTNLLDMPAFRVYPIPAKEPIAYSSVHGIVSDITGANFNSVYGVVVDLDMVGSFTSESLLIYHSYLPPTLTSINDTLLLSVMYDDALIRYVTAMALRQNEDYQSRAFASEELSLFEAELHRIYADAASGSSADKSTFEVSYRDGFSS